MKLQLQQQLRCNSDYHRLIPEPMDFTTLWNLLVTGTLQQQCQQQVGSGGNGPQRFLDLAIKVFQNAIDYNSMHQGKSVV